MKNPKCTECSGYSHQRKHLKTLYFRNESRVFKSVKDKLFCPKCLTIYILKVDEDDYLYTVPIK